MKTLAAIASALLLAACTGERATPPACRAILDRIVELELSERGFRDPVLLQRKQEELRVLLGDELRRCEGRRLPPDALVCIQTATNNEDLSHRCLQ